MAVLLLVRFVDESTGFLAPASVEDFRADLGMSYSSAAAMFVSYGIGGIVGNLAVAAGDGRSRKPVTVAGSLTLAVALATIGLAGAGWAVLLGTGLAALGSTGMVHGGEIAITNALAAAGLDHELERVLARGNLLAVVGDVTAPLLLAVLRAAGTDWRDVFLGASAVALVYACAIASVRFPDPVAVDDADGDVVPIRRQRLVWLLGAAAFVAMPLDEAYLATVLAYAESVAGWSGSTAALLGVAFVIGAGVAFGVLPDVIARTPLPRLMTIAGLGMSAVMVLAIGTPWWVLVTVGIAHSALLGSVWIGEQALVLRVNPGREGRTKLIVELLEGSAFSLVWLFGLVADRWGLRVAMGAYAAVPLLLPVIADPLRRLPDLSPARPRSRR